MSCHGIGVCGGQRGLSGKSPELGADFFRQQKEEIGEQLRIIFPDFGHDLLIKNCQFDFICSRQDTVTGSLIKEADFSEKFSCTDQCHDNFCISGPRTVNFHNSRIDRIKCMFR